MVLFMGGAYSEVVGSLRSNRVYYRCDFADSKSMCKGRIEFQAKNGQHDFNHLRDYWPHTRGCEYFSTNDSLRRMLGRLEQRNRPDQQARNRSKNWNSWDHQSRNHSKFKLNNNRNSRRDSDIRDRKSSENANEEKRSRTYREDESSRTSREEESSRASKEEEKRSKSFNLFQSMFNFEKELKSLIEHSTDEKNGAENRSFMKHKIDEYRSDFELLLSQFTTSAPHLDRASAPSPPAIPSVSSSSDSRSIPKREKSPDYQPADGERTSENGYRASEDGHRALVNGDRTLENIDRTSVNIGDLQPSDRKKRLKTERMSSVEFHSPVAVEHDKVQDLENRRDPVEELKVKMEVGTRKTPDLPRDDQKTQSNQPKFEMEMLDDGRINFYG